MAASETLEISLKADTKELIKALRELPDVGAKEARDMVRGIQREYRKAEKAARDLGRSKRDAAKDAADLGKSLKGTAKIAQGFGGEIGGVAGQLQNFVEGLGESISSLPLVAQGLTAAAAGAGGVATAAGAAVAGLVAIADAGLEARDALRETQALYQVPEDAIEALDRYAAATARLEREMNEAAVTIGGKAADNVAVLKSRIADLTDSMLESSDVTDGWADSFVRVASLGVADAFLGWRDAQMESTKAGLDQIAAWESSQKAGADYLSMIGEMAEHNTEKGYAVEAAAEAEKAATEEERARAAALREQAAAARAAAAAQLQLLAAEKTRAAIAREIEMAYRDQQQSFLDAESANEALFAKMRADADAANAAISGAGVDMGAAWSASIAEVAARFGDVAASVSGPLMGILADMHEQQMDAMIEEAQADDKITRAERKAIMQSFRATKRARVADAIMQSAFNAMALVPAFVGVAGPAAPIAAGVAAAAQLAASIAKIQSTKPPEFPGGGVLSADHLPVGMQYGEGVVTRSGMAGLGEQGLRRINEGQSMGGDRIVVQLGRKTLAEAVRGVARDTRDVLLDPRTGQVDPWSNA